MGCNISGPVSPAPDESEVNLTHFLWGRQVGKGGFGEVRVATKLTGVDKDIDYAMKIYKKRHLLKHSSGVQEVIWELSMLATLKSPWLCNARYAFQDEAYCYLVMDLALGGDLSYHHAIERKLTEEHVRIYLAQIYLAFEYLHNRKVLHRDIKPANVVLDADGFVKVTDMGISAHLNSNNICTKASGTPGFMAPELYTTTREHSFASDWWSYGVTAHRLLTGRAPFQRHAFKKHREIKLHAADLEKDAPTYPTPTLFLKEGTVLMRRSSSVIHNNNNDAGDAAAAAALRLKEKQRHKKKCVEVSPECALFVDQLLQKNPANRLGAKSSQEVKNHPFFAGFDWEALKARTLPVPFVPDTTTDNFCNDEDIMAEIFGRGHDGDRHYVVPEKDKSKFDDYHFYTVLHPPDKKRDLDGSAMFKQMLRGQFSSMRLESSSRSGASKSSSIRKTTTLGGVQEVVQEEEEEEGGGGGEVVEGEKKAEKGVDPPHNTPRSGGETGEVNVASVAPVDSNDGQAGPLDSERSSVEKGAEVARYPSLV